MNPFIVCFLVCLCAAGCTPQRRLNRLVARHPELVAVDTVQFRKVWPLPEKRALLAIPADRFYGELAAKHAVSVTDSATRITVGIADSAAGDTLFVQVDVPPDTLKIDEPVPVKTVTVVPTSRSIGRRVPENLPVLLLCAVVFVLVVLGRRR